MQPPISPNYDQGYRDGISSSPLVESCPGTPANSITVQNATGELIRIHADGSVTAPSIEASSEAGRVFINSMREHILFLKSEATSTVGTEGNEE